MHQSVEYQIKDKDGIIIGRFAQKYWRDIALRKYIKYGFPTQEVIEDAGKGVLYHRRYN